MVQMGVVFSRTFFAGRAQFVCGKPIASAPRGDPRTENAWDGDGGKGR